MVQRYSSMVCDILVHSDTKLKIYCREKYRQRYDTDAFAVFSLFGGVIFQITFPYDYYIIHLLTAIDLIPGDGSTVHIYIQIVHRTTRIKQYVEQQKCCIEQQKDTQNTKSVLRGHVGKQKVEILDCKTELCSSLQLVQFVCCKEPSLTNVLHM